MKSKEDVIVSVSKEKLIYEARILFDGTEEKDNPEYLRGMCELIASCFGEEDIDLSVTATKIKDLILGVS